MKTWYARSSVGRLMTIRCGDCPQLSSVKWYATKEEADKGHEEGLQVKICFAMKELDDFRARLAREAAASEEAKELPGPGRRYNEAYYEATWRHANPGVRTDWCLLGEEAREAWRDAKDATPPGPPDPPRGSRPEVA